MSEKRLDINYLYEIKCFYEWLERNALSASAIALWHGLMYLWNQSFWDKNFTPAKVSIMARTGLSDKTVLRARKELCAAGLLDVSSPQGRTLIRYNIIPFGGKNDTLYKQNKTKQNKTNIFPQRGKKKRVSNSELEANRAEELYKNYLNNLEHLKKDGDLNEIS